MDTTRGRKTRKRGEEGKTLPKSRPKRGQVETNISKQVLSSVIIQVKGKTAVQFNRNWIETRGGNQSLGSEAQYLDTCS